MMITEINTALLKSRLHEYIEHADDQHLAAMYVLLEKEIDTSSRYDEETLSLFYKRREAHHRGESKSFTVEEAFARIKAQHRK